MATTSQPPSGESVTSPRAYAAEIIQARTRAGRAELLSQVPDNFRPIVETHVRNHFARRAGDQRKSSQDRRDE